MKRLVKVLIVFFFFVSVFAYGIYWAFFDIQHIEGQEMLIAVSSSNQEYTVTAYLNSGGATTDYSVICKVRNNKTGRERNIYWNYHCHDAKIDWIDETSVIINGIELNVLKDTYDYRRN